MSRFGLALALLALACEDPREPGVAPASLTSAPVARWSGEGNADDLLGGYYGQIALWRRDGDARDSVGSAYGRAAMRGFCSSGGATSAFLFDGVDDHVFVGQAAPAQFTLPSPSSRLRTYNGTGYTLYVDGVQEAVGTPRVC